MNGNGRNYFFDGTYLFIKLMKAYYLAPGRSFFERAGARVYAVFSDATYIVNATCPPINEFACANGPQDPPSYVIV